MDEQAPNYHREFLKSPQHAALGLLTLGLGFLSAQLLPLIAGATLYTLGWIYLKKNLPDNALELFKNNVTKVPTNSTYRYHLGMALYQKGDKVHAKQELQTALTHNPSKEEAANIKELISKI